MTKLEPCPFCGLSNPHYDPDIQSIACPCSATGPSMLNREFDVDDEGKTYNEVEAEIQDAAAKAWNKRKL